MKIRLAALAALFLPCAAAAQGLSVYAGVALTSNYVSDGFTQTDDGPAIQPYVELDFNGLYAGAWGSNVDFGDEDDFELDLYVGYRGEAGIFSYDISYYRYYYNDSGFCCDEAILSLGVSPTDSLTLMATLSRDLEADETGAGVGIEFAVSDALTLHGEFAENAAGQYDYAVVGVSYALFEEGSLDLSWHKAEDEDGILALTLSFDTVLLGQ